MPTSSFFLLPLECCEDVLRTICFAGECCRAIGRIHASKAYLEFIAIHLVNAELIFAVPIGDYQVHGAQIPLGADLERTLVACRAGLPGVLVAVENQLG